MRRRSCRAPDFAVPPALEKLVGRLLERDPEKRPASGDEVLVELSPLRDAESSPLARRTVLLRRQMPLQHQDRGGGCMVAVAVGLAVAGAAESRAGSGRKRRWSRCCR